MNTLHLTVPLTIPQLAELLRTQFSPDERQQLAELILETKGQGDEPAEAFSLSSSLREAILELNQYKRGEITLPTLEEFLDELQD